MYQIAGKFINGSISMEELVLELRGGGFEFETAFEIALVAAVAYMLYANRVQGFQTQPLRLPYQQ